MLHVPHDCMHAGGVPSRVHMCMRSAARGACRNVSGLHVPLLQANVIAPNKHSSTLEPMFRGHLLESETYIGGKVGRGLSSSPCRPLTALDGTLNLTFLSWQVEALESGVFRSDLPTRFKLDPAAYQVRWRCTVCRHARAASYCIKPP